MNIAYRMCSLFSERKKTVVESHAAPQQEDPPTSHESTTGVYYSKYLTI